MTMRYRYKLSRFCNIVFSGGVKRENISTFAQKKINSAMHQIRLLQKKDCEKEI